MAITTANITKVIKVTDTEILVISGTQDLTGYAKTIDLGTAAFRDVGQEVGNVLELSGSAQITVGDEINSGQIIFASNAGNIDLRNEAGQFVFTNAGDEIFMPVGTGTIALLSQVGDRYLTSSTTSNTVSNGAKTFTVGTGLAYTPTQDITIVNDAAHHMHAVVTTYNSTTGVLVVDVNSHTGTGTYTAWTVNVGGISSAVIPTDGATGTVLTKASSTNYDAVWSTPSVAVGGITGLGTGVATALAVNVGSAGAPVVNGGAGGTPSSITLTNATGYPAATTTTAGTVPGIGINAVNAPTATNAATLAQINGLSRRTMSMLFTDFMGRLSGFQQTDGFVWGAQSGSGGSIADQASEASHPGINRLSTGATSASGFYGLDNASTNNSIYLLNDGTLYWEWCIRIPTLSDATNRFIVHVGCAAGNVSVSNEMFSIRYSDNVNSGKFLGVCRTASSETTVDTGITVAANTWYRVGALMNSNATSAQFYVDGVATGAAITTNIPTNTGRLGGGIYKTVGAAAARTMDVDYTYYLKTFTTAR